MTRLLVLSIAALALSSASAVADDRPAGGTTGIDLASAQLDQAGKLRLTIETRAPLDRTLLLPGRGYLCLRLARGAGEPIEHRICIRRASKSNHLSLKGVEGEVKAVGVGTVKATFLPQDAGIAPGSWTWSVVSAPDRVACPPESAGNGCGSRLPAQQPSQIRVKRARVAGCKRHGPSLVFHGSRNVKKIALSFDDGPSAYTSSVLRLLKRHRAHATFFELGTNMGGRAQPMNDILKAGDELGNHTWDHANVAGGGAFAASEIARTNARIKAITGFRPCLFRAPGGAIGSGLIGIAREKGMSTVQWDVDPTDWGLPGSAAIYSRVVNAAGAGSIVLMHDGGGPRGGTVAALGPILETLTRRGYKIVTVSELLGYELRYSSR